MGAQSGRWVPGHVDWTTTSEVLAQLDQPADSPLGIVCDLILEGSVLPFRPFVANWLFMRRHYTALFTKENCASVGCDTRMRTLLMKAVKSYFAEEGEAQVTVQDFLKKTRADWQRAYAVGHKMNSIILRILLGHGLKIK